MGSWLAKRWNFPPQIPYSPDAIVATISKINRTLKFGTSEFEDGWKRLSALTRVLSEEEIICISYVGSYVSPS